MVDMIGITVEDARKILDAHNGVFSTAEILLREFEPVLKEALEMPDDEVAELIGALVTAASMLVVPNIPVAESMQRLAAQLAKFD